MESVWQCLFTTKLNLYLSHIEWPTANFVYSFGGRQWRVFSWFTLCKVHMWPHTLILSPSVFSRSSYTDSVWAYTKPYDIFKVEKQGEASQTGPHGRSLQSCSSYFRLLSLVPLRIFAFHFPFLMFPFTPARYWGNFNFKREKAIYGKNGALILNQKNPSLLPIPSIPVSPDWRMQKDVVLLPSIHIYIHRQTFPLAVPPTTQSLVRWKTATAGTAVIKPSPPSCASCSPVDV